MRNNVVAISDIDTRALTRLLRSSGVMRGVIGTGRVNADELVDRARAIPHMEGADLVKDVTCADAVRLAAATRHAGRSHGRGVRAAVRAAGPAAPDRRVRLRHEVEHPAPIHRERLPGARVSRRARRRPSCWRRHLTACFSATGPAIRPRCRTRSTTRARSPKAACRCSASASAIRCSAWPWAHRTFKLKFGHRGANHPVKELRTEQIEITSQNHGFAVDPETLPKDVEVTHLNLYDGTIEGLAAQGPSRCSACSTTRKRRRARTTPTTCSASSWKRWKSARSPPNAQTNRSETHSRHRLGPDRHRTGLRVRLLRHPGLQGAA